jgi:endoglycosylceramidase
MQAFEALWTNRDGLTDKFVDYWDHTSAAFANNKYVVGYDPLNEPFPGNVAGGLKGAKLLLPGHADEQHLAPVYARLYDVYQKNDPGSVMWFEPT